MSVIESGLDQDHQQSMSPGAAGQLEIVASGAGDGNAQRELYSDLNECFEIYGHGLRYAAVAEEKGEKLL